MNTPTILVTGATGTWGTGVRAEGVVRFPYGEAALAPIAEQDIAAAAARVLLDPDHAGTRTPTADVMIAPGAWPRLGTPPASRRESRP